MPIFREYRIVLPLSVEEYQIARQWHKLKKLKVDLQSIVDEPRTRLPTREKIVLEEVTQSMPFVNGTVNNETVEHCIIERDGSGDYMFTGNHSWLESVVDNLGNNSKTIQIETWEAYPYFHSLSEIDVEVGSSYEVIVDSVCLPGNGQLENALNLPMSVLLEREVIFVDIAKHSFVKPTNTNSGDGDSDDLGFDPIFFRSEKADRGPLRPGWMESADPVMTCYLLMRADFEQISEPDLIIEKNLHNEALHKMTAHNLEMFYAIDDWIDIPLSELVDQEMVIKMKIRELVGSDTRITRNNDSQRNNGGRDRRNCCCAIDPFQFQNSIGILLFLTVCLLIMFDCIDC